METHNEIMKPGMANLVYRMFKNILPNYTLNVMYRFAIKSKAMVRGFEVMSEILTRT